MLNVKKSNKTLKLLLIFSVFSAVILTGCDLSYLGFRDTTKGALNVSLNTSRFASCRTIQPTTDMTPAEYIISGTGPGEATFKKTITGSSCNIYDLAVGSWTISVAVNNASAQQIGWGESVVIVSASTISDASVLVEPYTGKGAVAFSVSWNDAEVASPSISAFLTDTSGNDTELPFTLGAGTATYSESDVPSGYYTLNIKLLDDGNKVSGMVESVRVLQDFQTTGDFNFTDLNNPSGDISISVIVDMLDPFEPAINGAVATLSYGTDMSVSAAVPDSDGETLIYKWFVNGDLVGSSENITFGSDLRWGNYRLDLVVTNETGTRSGSASHTFTVE